LPGDGDLVLEVRDQRLLFAFDANALDDAESLQRIPDLLRSHPTPGTTYRWDATQRRWRRQSA